MPQIPKASLPLYIVFLLLAACQVQMPSPASTSTPYPAAMRATPQVQKVSPDDDAMMVITQFYTLSGHGFYDEAYNLLSLGQKRKARGLEAYRENARQMRITAITLYTVQPLYEWSLRQDRPVLPDPAGLRRFAVWLSAEGEGGMAGSVPNGIVQTIFITLKMEDGAWKICALDTLPTTAAPDCE